MKTLKLSQIQKEVLHTLTDRYENRSDYASATKSGRRTLLKVDARSYPDYFHVSDSSFRLMFNAEMQELQHRTLVALDWERFNKGEYLLRVALAEDALPEIYRLLKRTPKKDLYNATALLLTEWSKEAPPELHSFYRHTVERLSRLEVPPRPVKPGENAELVQLLQGLHACFEPRKSEIAKRLLSVRLYSNSKRWQTLEKRIVEILREFCLSGEEASYDDTRILAERGIVDNPMHINLAGPLVFSTNEGQVNLAAFYPDLGLSAEMAGDLTIESCDADAVVTVENKTSFYQYLREATANHLVLYLGGYHNTPRRELLKKLYHYFLEHDKRIIFYHWGDMDLGGINIWYDLKQKTGIPFQPIYMDVETYNKNLHRGYPVEEAYCRKLALLLENSSMEIFHPLIRQILNKKICIEQEAVTVIEDNAVF